MQIEFTSAPGTSLLAKSLPNGAMIKGLKIDNPSGNWLYVVSEQLYCPPYTIGWAMPTSYDQSSINVEARLTGPASAVGTNQGDSWTLTLFDTPQNPSAGVPYQFVQQYTGTQFASNGIYVGVALGGVVPTVILTIPAITGKRFRILTLALEKIEDVPADFQIYAGTTGIFSWEISQPDHVKDFTWPEGLDLPISTKFEVQGTPTNPWSAGFTASAFVTYRIL